MSLLDRLEVPEARSRASTRATRRPRDAASSAVPAPVMPPPMTSTSNRSVASRLSIAPRSRASRTPLLAINIPPYGFFGRRGGTGGQALPPLQYVHRQPSGKLGQASEQPFTLR